MSIQARAPLCCVRCLALTHPTKPRMCFPNLPSNVAKASSVGVGNIVTMPDNKIWLSIPVYSQRPLLCALLKMACSSRCSLYPRLGMWLQLVPHSSSMHEVLSPISSTPTLSVSHSEFNYFSYHHDKIFRQKRLKGGRACSGSQFERTQSII